MSIGARDLIMVNVLKRLVVLSLLGMGLFLAPESYATELCKWVDETGCVHFDSECPEGVEGESIKLVAGAPATGKSAPSEAAAPGMSDKTLETVPEIVEQSTSRRELLSHIHEVYGCWQRVRSTRLDYPSRIELFAFEEPDHQYFCFGRGGRLLIYMTNTLPDWPLSQLSGRIEALHNPPEEWFHLSENGLIDIRNTRTGATLPWTTYITRGHLESEGLMDGDLLMSLRHEATAEDLYIRHLRRVD